MDKHRKTRIPKLRFTDVQDIGWHVSYRDPVTKTPRRYRFGIRERAREEEALAAYHRWLGEHLNGETPKLRSAPRPTSPKAVEPARESEEAPIASTPGSVMDIASGLIVSLEARVRGPDERRRQGTIARRGFIDRRRHIRDFLAYLNKQHGKGTTSRMLLSEISLADVEGYNRCVVRQGYSFAQVNGRMQMVKHIIDRARRPEHGDLPPVYVPGVTRVGNRFCSSSIACWGWRSVAEPVPTGVALALPTSLIRPPTLAANAAGVS